MATRTPMPVVVNPLVSPPIVVLPSYDTCGCPPASPVAGVMPSAATRWKYTRNRADTVSSTYTTLGMGCDSGEGQGGRGPSKASRVDGHPERVAGQHVHGRD